MCRVAGAASSDGGLMSTIDDFRSRLAGVKSDGNGGLLLYLR